MNAISVKDKERLRKVASQLRELANSESMLKTIKLWKAHNACRGERPMVRVELDTFAHEIITPLQQCQGDEARALEWQLLSMYVNPVLFGDDSVVRDFYPIQASSFFKPFDIDVQVEHADDGIGHHFVPVLEDLEDDFEKIKKSTFGINREATKKRFEFISDALGDALPAKVVGGSLYAVPTQDIVHIMSMEDIYLAMAGSPELFKKMIMNLADDYVEYFEYLGREGVLKPTTESENLGQGTYCFTDELPSAITANATLAPTDVWGYADSQETVAISETMFRELVFPAYKKVAESFGLLSYGCCEPVEKIWDSCLSTLPNLRKVSISPWCDESIMGERLAGSNIVYHRKPDATILGVGTALDEGRLRASIKKTLECAGNCTIEFTQRDVYTVNHDVSKVKRYVEIIREEIQKKQLGELPDNE